MFQNNCGMMTTGTATSPSAKEDRIIILPIRQENHEKIVIPPGNFELGWIRMIVGIPKFSPKRSRRAKKPPLKTASSANLNIGLAFGQKIAYTYQDELPVAS